MKKLFFCFALFFYLSINAEPLDIYVFTDFGGGRNAADEPIADWQTAIELAGEGWKLTGHPRIFINDSAVPLEPALASGPLAQAFPFLGANRDLSIRQIVVHVIDPGVGNQSAHARVCVLRKDGVLFIGPDNGTLDAACPPHAIAAVWEIDIARISKKIGIDLEAGGTFHGRDVFIAVAYLIADGKLALESVGKHRGDIKNCPLQFQEVSTTRWNFSWDKKKNGSEERFALAYLLAVIQSPLPKRDEKYQLFFVEGAETANPIAIINCQLGTIYVGPNNGIGSCFFSGFSKGNWNAFSVSETLYREIQKTQGISQILEWILKEEPLIASPILIDLHAKTTVFEDEMVWEGRIWIDAYGNIKTSIPAQEVLAQIEKGFSKVSVELNGVVQGVVWASSFAEISAGIPLICAGSSGVVGWNPGRSRRYLEISSNGVDGTFGIHCFKKGTHLPKSGQKIILRCEKEGK